MPQCYYVCFEPAYEFYHAFFFFFLVILNNFLIIPVVKEKIRVRLALAIPADAPITLANEIIDIPPVVALRTIKILST